MTEFMVFLWFIICFFHKKFPLKKTYILYKSYEKHMADFMAEFMFFFYGLFYVFFHKILQKNHILF